MFSRRTETDEPVVTILLKNCHQYRVSFFEQLETNLSQKGIRLRLVFGGGLPEDEAKGDRAWLSSAELRNFRTLRIFGRSLLWQPALDIARASDLVITEQASKQLFNVVLSIGQRYLGTRHAFWGHGKNFQSSVEGDVGEGLKRWLTKRAVWFFSYNDLSTEAAIDFGMDADRVTAVMNSTDTNHIRQVRSALPDDIADKVRAELQMGPGPVAIYLGGVYHLKRPEFLIEAAKEIRNRIPDFEMLVIGNGTSGHLMEQAAKEYSWFHHVGACYGDQKVALASVASLQLMPGLVGLNVVDGFALGLPTITADVDYHSPEIEYLKDGVNGLVLPADVTASEYAAHTAELLGDETRLSMLRSEAEAQALELSTEEMARRFADGVVQALL